MMALDKTVKDLPTRAYNRVRSHFWRMVAPCFSRHSDLGRMIRARGCDFLLARCAMAMYGEFAHAQQVFRAFAPDSEVLVLGSSHPFHAINPGSAKQLRMWNASFCSGDAWITYHTYLAIREKWPKRPGQIVLFGEDFWEAHLQTEYLRQGFLVAVILHLLIGMPYRNAFLLRDYERTLKKMTSCNNLPPPSSSGDTGRLSKVRGWMPRPALRGIPSASFTSRRSCRCSFACVRPSKPTGDGWFICERHIGKTTLTKSPPVASTSGHPAPRPAKGCRCWIISRFSPQTLVVSPTQTTSPQKEPTGSHPSLSAI